MFETMSNATGAPSPGLQRMATLPPKKTAYIPGSSQNMPKMSLMGRNRPLPLRRVLNQ